MISLRTNQVRKFNELSEQQVRPSYVSVAYLARPLRLSFSRGTNALRRGSRSSASIALHPVLARLQRLHAPRATPLRVGWSFQKWWNFPQALQELGGYKVRGERKTPNLQAAAGPFQPTRPTGAQVGPAAVGRGALAACRRAAPGEVGRCAAAWPARRVGRRGSRHPGMLQLQPGRGGGADCCAPGSQLGWEDLRWSGREGSRGPQSRGPAAPERRRRRFKLAPVNFFVSFFLSFF